MLLTGSGSVLKLGEKLPHPVNGKKEIRAVGTIETPPYGDWEQMPNLAPCLRHLAKTPSRWGQLVP